MTTGPAHALVTGASGYIGSRLVTALANSGVRVTRALERARIPDTVAGVWNTDDPLLLVDTDPEWAN